LSRLPESDASLQRTTTTFSFLFAFLSEAGLYFAFSSSLQSILQGAFDTPDSCFARDRFALESVQSKHLYQQL